MSADPALTAENACSAEAPFAGFAVSELRCVKPSGHEGWHNNGGNSWSSERACDHTMMSCFDCGSDNHHTGHRLCQVSNADDGYSITVCSFEERTKPCGIEVVRPGKFQCWCDDEGAS